MLSQLLVCPDWERSPDTKFCFQSGHGKLLRMIDFNDLSDVRIETLYFRIFFFFSGRFCGLEVRSETPAIIGITSITTVPRLPDIRRVSLKDRTHVLKEYPGLLSFCRNRND